ncbi:M16 family metallopeptidase [Marinigracilibium pacificum]|uniref:Insulinase family protein n=1 Tax=Marinigracilibium pacificum TaxID=2729599 RepID=A0A848IYG5_9BACT|nr:pitrilysin family protein [Marinigracilibium pacificum]NMM48676.1 insulinase family protein [Marinigracilibium pacificum]
MLDRTKAPYINDLVQQDIIRAQEAFIFEKTPVFFVHSDNQEALKIEIITDSGSKSESVPAAASTTLSLLNEGTTSRSGSEISEGFDKLGAFTDFNNTSDRQHISCYTLERFFPECIEMLSDVWLNPAFPEHEIERYQSQKAEQIAQQRKKNQYKAAEIFKNSLFGLDHPYGRTVGPEELKAVTRQDLIDFHPTMYRNPIILLSGKITDRVLSSLQDHLKKIPVQKHTNTPLPKGNQTTGQIVIDRPESLQSSIRMGLPVIDRGHEDYYKLVVTNEIFGGYFGSRLMKNIREDKGYTYGIHSRLMHLEEAGYLIIGTDVVKDKTSDTLIEIKKELEILSTENVPDSEFRTVINYLKGNFISSVNTPYALTDKFKSIYFFGLDYSFYDEYFTNLDKITPEDIKSTVNKYLLNDQWTEVIVGGLK